MVLPAAAALTAVGFVLIAAVPYFTLDQQRFGPYWPRRGWLLLHIAGGMVALLTGPGQVWLGLNGRGTAWHRRLGMAYVASVAVSSIGAFYLAFTTTFGWAFGAGLIALAIAWLTTTGLAFAAVRRYLLEQHKEWMIRSYVVTFAFVTFRLAFPVLQAIGIGTLSERFAIAIWLSWPVPLLVTEAFLQGRKILAIRFDSIGPAAAFVRDPDRVEVYSGGHLN
jgi:uncharacterized membrane protein